MKNRLFNQAKTGFSGKFLALAIALVALQFIAVETSFAQAKKRNSATKKTTATAVKKAPPAKDLNLPKVTQIDLLALQSLLKREAGESSRPLLINFWATWCDPCREEFPDLVEIDRAYKGKIDFITISLDELSEINRDVPKFLAQMKAEMPAYLLKTPDEEAAISTVAKDWQGGLPFTILFNAKGETVFTRQGKVKPDILRTELDKTIVPAAATTIGGDSSRIVNQQIVNLPLSQDRLAYSYEKGLEDAKKDLAGGRMVIRRYGLTPAIPSAQLKKLKESGIQIMEHGCIIMPGFVDYARGYNEVMIAEIKRKFGARISNELAAVI